MPRPTKNSTRRLNRLHPRQQAMYWLAAQESRLECQRENLSWPKSPQPAALLPQQAARRLGKSLQVRPAVLLMGLLMASLQAQLMVLLRAESYPSDRNPGRSQAA